MNKGIVFAGSSDIVYPNAIEVPAKFDWPGGNKMRKIPGFRTIVDDNDGAVLGVVQSSYKLVKYEDTIEKFEKGLAEVLSEEYDYMEIEKDVRFFQGKSQMSATYTFPGFAFDIAGDECHPQVNLERSYNRTIKMQLALSLMRLVCTNGLRMPVKVGGFSRLHTKNLDQDQLIGDLLGEILNITQHKTLFSKLSNTPVKNYKSSIEMLYDNPAKPKFEFPKRYLPMVEKNWEGETGRSMWNLYNGFNSVINHHIDAEKGRPERARALDENLYNRFELITA